MQIGEGQKYEPQDPVTFLGISLLPLRRSKCSLQNISFNERVKLRVDSKIQQLEINNQFQGCLGVTVL